MVIWKSWKQIILWSIWSCYREKQLPVSSIDSLLLLAVFKVTFESILNRPIEQFWFDLQQGTMVPVLARAMEDNFIANRKFTSCYNINILYVGLAYGV